MEPANHPDPFQDALSQGLHRALQVASSVITGAQVYLYLKRTQARAVAERDERARRALAAQIRADRDAARSGWAPALDPGWLRRADLFQTAQAWGAAMPYADRTMPWYEPAAATAMRKCEERLRLLHPYAMARYDRLRGEGMGPAEAMREAAPLFGQPSHARDGEYTDRHVLDAGNDENLTWTADRAAARSRRVWRPGPGSGARTARRADRRGTAGTSPRAGPGPARRSGAAHRPGNRHQPARRRHRPDSPACSPGSRRRLARPGLPGRGSTTSRCRSRTWSPPRQRRPDTSAASRGEASGGPATVPPPPAAAMTAGRASPGQPPPVSALDSGADWAAWLRQATPVCDTRNAQAWRPGPGGGMGCAGVPGPAPGIRGAPRRLRHPGRVHHLARPAHPGARRRGTAAAVTALAHQLAHVLLHGRIARLDPGGSVPCQGTRKVEADSVAYLVTVHLGIDTPAITFPHVSSWAGTDPRAQPGRTIQTVSRRVLAAADLINRYLDAELGIGQSPRAPVPAASAEASQAAPAVADRGDLVRVHQAAAQFFRSHMPGSWVPGYLSARGFGTVVQQRWQIGYAPAGWDTLTCHLRAAGYPDRLIEAAGLAHRSRRGTLIDTFRDRAVLPIRAADGTIVAFIGRAPAGAGPGVPKYLNSPHTALYDKSSVLFGLWEARGALASGARPVIVEGPFDAIAVTTAGHGRYAGVAPCGTALTSHHLATLDDAADLQATGVLVAFDPDQAGRARCRAGLPPAHPAHQQPDLGEASRPGKTQRRSSQSHGPSALASSARTRPSRSLTWSSTPRSPGGAGGCNTPRGRSTHCAPPLPSSPPCPPTVSAGRSPASPTGSASIYATVTGPSPMPSPKSSPRAGSRPHATAQPRAGPREAGNPQPSRRPGRTSRALRNRRSAGRPPARHRLAGPHPPPGHS